jgi:hypothetical protein
MDNISEGGEHLVQDSDDDVHRAMATFTASGIPYRTFAAPLIAPALAKQDINDATLIEPSIEARRVDAFPLLTAALPEVTQFPIPHPFVARDTARAAPPTPSNGTWEASLNTGMRPPAPKQLDTLSDARTPGVFSLPASKSPLTHKRNPYSAGPNGTGDRTTPLAAVFRILQLESPTRQDRTASHSQLQNVLRRL